MRVTRSIDRVTRILTVLQVCPHCQVALKGVGSLNHSVTGYWQLKPQRHWVLVEKTTASQEIDRVTGILSLLSACHKEYWQCQRNRHCRTCHRNIDDVTGTLMLPSNITGVMTESQENWQFTRLPNNATGILTLLSARHKENRRCRACHRNIDNVTKILSLLSARHKE